MSKGKSTWKYNRLLTARRNYFWPGGNLLGELDILGMSSLNPLDGIVDLKNVGSTQAIHNTIDLRGPAGNSIRNAITPKDTKGGFLGLDWSNPFKGSDIKNKLAGTIGGAVGNIGGALIGNGYSSGAGSAMRGLSGIASAIPGPWGAVAGGALSLGAGVADRFFGSKMNTENIAKVEANINALNSFKSDASNFDQLAQNWANAVGGMEFSNSFIGSDGLFSNKASKKANSLREQVAAGKLWADNSLNNNAENISDAQMGTLLENYLSLGGSLLSKGGSIYIKPENRGKFTETKKRTGKTTEELTHSKNPLTRKRAIFSQNAKKWHHAFGGELNTQGGDFTNGLLYIDSGGSHETNPNEGVPFGYDQNGVPNLVEEGETVFNDYVFSKRLRVPKSLRKKYKLGKDMSYAEASKKLAKESEERPNDPISMRGLEYFMQDLAMSQEVNRAKDNNKKFSKGGNLFGGGGDSGQTTTKPRMVYEHKVKNTKDNTLSNLPIGEYYYTGRDFSTGNTWEEDFGDKYSFDINKDYADYTLPDGTTLRRYFYTPKTPESSKVTPKSKYFYRDANGTNPTEVTGNDPVTEIMNKGRYTLGYKSQNDDGSYNYYYDPVKETPSVKPRPTWMRYTPATALGITSLTDALGLTNKPDYTNADTIAEMYKGTSLYKPVSFSPLGNYLTYRPFDRDYYLNKMSSEAGATRRNLLNTSGGNRATAMAGLLATDNQYLGKVGELARQAEEFNTQQKQAMAGFNRETDSINASGMFQADSANQKAFMGAMSQYLKGMETAAAMREKAGLTADADKSANLSNFITSIGDIGRENMVWNWRDFYKATSAPIREDLEKLLGGDVTQPLVAAKGGKIKRRKGLTY